MTNIPGFANSHSGSRQYHRVHAQMLKLGRGFNGTNRDLRADNEDSTQFRLGPLDVYTNHEKQQVVLVEKLEGSAADPNYISVDFQEELSRQVYRSVLKPNRWGVLEVRERVDSRDVKGEVVNAWERLVETDFKSGSFSITMLNR